MGAILHRYDTGAHVSLFDKSGTRSWSYL